MPDLEGINFENNFLHDLSNESLSSYDIASLFDEESFNISKADDTEIQEKIESNSDSSILVNFILDSCPFGSSCTITTSEHKNDFLHPGHPDFTVLDRPKCVLKRQCQDFQRNRIKL